MTSFSRIRWPINVLEGRLKRDGPRVYKGASVARMPQQSCLSSVMAFLRFTSPNGHPYDEVLSCLEKSIQRGLCSEALYWANEMRGKWEKALRRRTLLIALEATPYRPILDFITNEINNENPEMDRIFHVIVTMCKLPKTHIVAWVHRLAIEYLVMRGVPLDCTQELVNSNRIIEAVVKFIALNSDERANELHSVFADTNAKHIFNVSQGSTLVFVAVLLHRFGFFQTAPTITVDLSEPLPAISQERLEVPEWALDKHTRRGAVKGHGYKHYFEVAFVLTPRLFGFPEPYEEDAKIASLAAELRFGKKCTDRDLYNIWRERQSTKSPTRGTKRSSDSDSGSDLEIIQVYDVSPTRTPAKQKLKAPTTPPAPRKPKHKVPSCSESDTDSDAPSSQETPSVAPKRRRTEPPLTLSFAHISELLPSAPPEYKYPKLTDCFTDMVQTQLRTSKRKPFVRFATDIGTGAKKVIKGPMQAPAMAEQIISERFKKLLSLPHCNVAVGYFQEGSFLVMDSLIDYDISKRRTVVSKIENTVVVTEDNLHHWNHSILTNNSQQSLVLEVLLSLAFRRCIGTTDNTPRNLIIAHNHIFSIDDPAKCQPTQLLWKMSTQAHIYNLKRNQLWQTIYDTICRWIEVVSSPRFEKTHIPDIYRAHFLEQAQLLKNVSEWKF